MIKAQEQVKEFHKTFGYTINNIPTLKISNKEKELRIYLIKEELEEFETAINENDIVEIADALGDLLYVVYGAAVTFGIDMEEISDEIHKSNMTKIEGHRREDGKWIKPDSYEAPKIKEIILKQLKGV